MNKLAKAEMIFFLVFCKKLAMKPNLNSHAQTIGFAKISSSSIPGGASMGVHDTYLEVRVVMHSYAERDCDSGAVLACMLVARRKAQQSMCVPTIYARRPRTGRADKDQRGRTSPADWTLDLSLHTGQA